MIAPAAVGCKRLLRASSSDGLSSMTLKARVRAGRLVVDEPTDLPEGTEVELLPLAPGIGSTRQTGKRFMRLCGNPTLMWQPVG
jgi:hypothetical protein